MKKVITYGSFDLFHQGHYNLLKHAHELGDTLIVGVTTEQYDISRGKLNIVDSLMRRIENVRQTGFADEIIIEDHEGQKIEDIQKYNIDIFTIGSDWRGKFDYLNQYCSVVYIERTKNVSSTALRNKRYGIVRLGIAGTGRIAGRFVQEIVFVSGIESIGVYNPHIESAQRFANQHELGFYSDDYDVFLDEIDAVYIATPHDTHYDYARRAILAHKHVLCEKPLVLKEAEARELFALAAKQGVVLMEAVKTAYAPGFINLIAIARSGRIGKIYDIEAAFTKLVPNAANAREYDPDVGGSFTELASYSLLPVIKLLGHNYRNINFEYFIGSNGCDIYAKAHFKYNDALATAKTGIGVKSEGQLSISGELGYIIVKSPWWLLKSFDVCYENILENETFSAPFLGYGLRYEIADFTRRISDPISNNYKLTSEESIAMSRIMEKFLIERKNTQLLECV